MVVDCHEQPIGGDRPMPEVTSRPDHEDDDKESAKRLKIAGASFADRTLKALDCIHDILRRHTTLPLGFGLFQLLQHAHLGSYITPNFRSNELGTSNVNVSLAAIRSNSSSVPRC